MRRFSKLILAAAGWLALAGGPARGQEATPRPPKPTALAGATVLIIRHAEKPDDGGGLNPAGAAHAKDYVNYFKHYRVDGETPIRPTALFAAADSELSRRPFLTLQPLGQALGMRVDTRFANKDFDGLADALRASPHGRLIVVCWHHGHLPELVQALGGDPERILPGGEWPDDQYGWVVQLRYDARGQLAAGKLVTQQGLQAGRQRGQGPARRAIPTRFWTGSFLAYLRNP